MAIQVSGTTVIDNNRNITNAGTYNGYTPAPVASPAFTGTPTAPTAAVGTNTTQLATTAFVLANTGSYPTQTQATWNTGTSTTESVISPAKLAGAMDLAIASQALGVGQTWQTVIRVVDTTYQNTLGKPITVSIEAVSGATTSSRTRVLVGVSTPLNATDHTAATMNAPSAGGSSYSAAVVPPGHYYQFGTAGSPTSKTFRELR